MKKLEMLQQLRDGKPVVHFDTLYEGGNMWKEVDVEDEAFDLLHDYIIDSSAFFDLSPKIAYDLYSCYIETDKFNNPKDPLQELNLLYVNLLPEDHCDTDIRVYFRFDGKWYVEA